MRGRVWLLAAALVALVAPLGAAAAGDDTWYAQRLTGGDTPLRVEHFWSKGRKLRTQTVVGGYPIVTIVNGATYYVIDPLRGFGLAIERSSRAQGLDAERKTKRPFGLEGERLIADGAEPVRKGKLAGRQSQLYRQTDHLGRREVWITDDALGLPLRLEAFDRSSGATVRTDFVDWARDLPIPDGFFEPPAGVQLERLTYDEYVKRSAEEVLGPAPVMHGDLLHGR